MLKGCLLKFSGPLGVGEKLLVFLAVVVVDMNVGVVLTTDVEVGLSLLNFDAGVVGVLVPPTIVGENITWLLLSVFFSLFWTYNHAA